MKSKKLLIVAIALAAVCGCLLFVGCSSGSTSSSSTNGSTQKTADPFVGQWGVQIQRDGKTVDAVLDASEDGVVHFMVLGHTPGIQLTQASVNTWEKTGENAYAVVASEGEHTYAYDAQSDTLTDEKGQVFNRLDPYVGIWSGLASEKVGGGNTTTIIKPDGTGLTYAAFNDGTSRVLKMTWTKNDDGTYNITLSDGNTATVSVDAEGKTATTSDGFTLKKDLRTQWYLLSMTGTWYNAETNTVATFNGDGTGFINQGGKTVNFTWEMKETGIFETTLTDGTAPDGTKTAQWTYDSSTDTFTSSDGTVYSRPIESVEDLITLYS